MALATISHSFSKFANSKQEEKVGNEQVWQNGLANFGPTGLTGQRGPCPGVVPGVVFWSEETETDLSM